MHDLSFCCSVLLNSIWSFSHWEILTRMSKHSLTLWNIVARILSCLFCLQLKVVFELVDRPTQLICIWISILCQHTNTKDIAGQSAMFGHNMFSVLISWQTNNSQGQSQHKIYFFGVLFCDAAQFFTSWKSQVLVFGVPLLCKQLIQFWTQSQQKKASSSVFPFYDSRPCMFIFVLEFSSNTFTKCNIGWQLSTNIWKRNGAILHVCFNMELRSSLQYGVCTERPAFANCNIAKL